MHDREWTYCLALPQGHPLSRTDPGHLPRLIHGAIARGLNEKAFPRCFRGIPPTGKPGLAVFPALDPGDLLLNGSKIMGSAQRRRKGCLLQHGGLLLGQSRSESAFWVWETLPGTWNEDEVPVLWNPGLSSGGYRFGSGWFGFGFPLEVPDRGFDRQDSSSEWLNKR